MSASSGGKVYHRLVVEAAPGTDIWLACDAWFLVQKEVGRLDTSVLRDRYYVEFGQLGLDGVAYPVELTGDVRLTQAELEAGPACPRQAPQLLDE